MKVAGETAGIAFGSARVPARRAAEKLRAAPLRRSRRTHRSPDAVATIRESCRELQKRGGGGREDMEGRGERNREDYRERERRRERGWDGGIRGKEGVRKGESQRETPYRVSEKPKICKNRTYPDQQTKIRSA
eukprot:3888871-Pleurochrysis_carterae.AAC.1